MKFLICRPLAALFVAAAVLTASLALANIDVGGVDFKSQDSVENTRVELNGAHLADGNVGGHLGPARGLGHPAAIGAGDLEVVTVHVDRVIGHGKITHPDTHAVVL